MNLKNLLLPVTNFMWAATTYYGCVGILLSYPLLVYMSWFWLLILYTFMIGIISLIISFSSAVSSGIMYLYKFNWVSVITHSLSGLLSVIWFIVLYIQKVNETGNDIFEIIWNESAMKTIVLAPGVISLAIGLIFTMVIMPIYIKLKHDEGQDY